jgi:endonuclease/exonuclease/phosphatase family metal-dependent hydrolase
MQLTRTSMRIFMGTTIAAAVFAALAILETPASGVAFQAPPGSPVAHWQLDEQDGTATATDASAYGNTGTVADANKWTAGLLNGSLEFNGSTDHVRVPAPSGSSLRRPSGGYAISAWVKVAGTGPKGGDVATMGDNYALRVQPDGNVKTFFYSSTWHPHTTTGVNVSDGRWHHLVGQYDGTNVTVYVDGEQKGATPFPGLTINYAKGSDFYLGKHGNNGSEHTFAGFIDQVRVYENHLTPDEIARLAAEPPVAHWKLDETAGSTTAQDSSTNGNTGTVSDPQQWTSAGQVDGALAFTGSSSVTVNPVAMPAARSLKPQRTFAISAWVKADGTGPNGAEIATMGDSYALRIQPNGNVKVFFNDGGWRTHLTTTVDVVGDGRWHHLVGQYDGNLMEIYVDGVRYPSPPYSGSPINYGLGASFRLGQHGNGSALYGFRGTIDQVRVYARALTPAEITAQAGEGGVVEPPTTETFRVLTWNVRKCRDTSYAETQDCAETAQTIARLQPDVVILSAVQTQQHANQIAAALGFPAPHYGKASTPATTEGQAIMSRYPMDGAGSQYPPLVHQVQSQYTSEDQVIVRATLTIAGRKVHVFGIDQDHLTDGARREQATQFREWAWQYKNDGLPMIVAGDFNNETGNGVDEWLIKPDPLNPGDAFFDDWTRAESRTSDTSSSGRTRRWRVDHILSYRGSTGLETGTAKVSLFFRPLTTCSDVKVTLCKTSECGGNACASAYHEDTTGVRASDHALLMIEFRLPSGS